MFKYINTKREDFNAWVATWLPGMKTKIVASLGAVGMFSSYMQEYISGLPLDQFVSSKTVALISGGMFTLAYWFKSLGNSPSA